MDHLLIDTYPHACSPTHPCERAALGDERGLAVVALDESGQAQLLDVLHLYVYMGEGGREGGVRSRVGGWVGEGKGREGGREGVLGFFFLGGGGEGVFGSREWVGEGGREGGRERVGG